MRRVISLILVVCLSIFFMGCENDSHHFDDKEQEYYAGYEDLIHMISDDYGKYVYVEILSRSTENCKEINLIVRLVLKGSYADSPEFCEGDHPYWIVFENVRCDLNGYLSKNPESLLADDLNSSPDFSSLEMTIVQDNNRRIPDEKLLIVNDFDRSGQFNYFCSIYPDINYLENSPEDIYGLYLEYYVIDEEKMQLEKILDEIHKFPNLKKVNLCPVGSVEEINDVQDNNPTQQSELVKKVQELLPDIEICGS